MQKLVGPLAVITGVAGKGFTVTTVGAETGETHWLASVICTVNVPEEETAIEEVVEPFDHRKSPVPEAESCTDPPWQKVSGPLADIMGVPGLGFTVTIVDCETAEMQPSVLVTVREKLPLAETVMLWVVAPFDHW